MQVGCKQHESVKKRNSQMWTKLESYTQTGEQFNIKEKEYLQIRLKDIIFVGKLKNVNSSALTKGSLVFIYVSSFTQMSSKFSKYLSTLRMVSSEQPNYH